MVEIKIARASVGERTSMCQESSLMAYSSRQDAQLACELTSSPGPGTIDKKSRFGPFLARDGQMSSTKTAEYILIVQDHKSKLPYISSHQSDETNAGPWCGGACIMLLAEAHKFDEQSRILDPAGSPVCKPSSLLAEIPLTSGTDGIAYSCRSVCDPSCCIGFRVKAPYTEGQSVCAGSRSTLDGMLPPHFLRVQALVSS